jgi:hypothetical protein
MHVLCHCSRKTLDVEKATYVLLGRPCCTPECFRSAISDTFAIAFLAGTVLAIGALA